MGAVKRAMVQLESREGDQAGLEAPRRSLFHWISLTLLHLFHALEHLQHTKEQWRSRSPRHPSAVSPLDPGGETFLRLLLLPGHRHVCNCRLVSVCAWGSSARGGAVRTKLGWWCRNKPLPVLHLLWWFHNLQCFLDATDRLFLKPC